MADQQNNGVPKRKPVPRQAAQAQAQTQPPLPDDWAAELTQQFRRALSTKRMNALSHRPSSLRRPSTRRPNDPNTDSRPPTSQSTNVPANSTNVPANDARVMTDAPHTDEQPKPTTTSYSTLHHIPVVPVAPTDLQSLRFRSMLLSLSRTPCNWENPGLLDEALGVIPLQRIYDEAQEEADLFTAEAASMGDGIKPAWGYHDCVVRALLKWFKNEFFEWVNNPLCSTCRTRTIAQGMAAPLPDESARGANRVELYQCANQNCLSYERFPRYNDAFVLLQTRRGRCGEWANCFSMLCRAVGSRVRWVWNAEDHVWTEIYSDHRKRWIHVDVCEEQWDAPMLYTHGWGKKLSYCIAFGADGCVDVTRRYVRTNDHAVPRNRCSEAVLTHILREITSLRRRDMDKQERFRLMSEDMREDAELRKLIIEALAYSISKIFPNQESRNPLTDPDATKAVEAAQGRQSGNTEWIQQRGEAGPDQRLPPSQ